MDDARQGGIACCRAYAKLQRARLVDGAREHRVAHTFFHRQAFPGDRRLINRRAAADHLTIEADALARTHPHHRAQPDGLHVELLPTAIGLLHGSARRRQIHQPAYGVTCPIQRARLDQFGQGKQHHHHRCFRPLADQHRAGHGDTHQGIDIEVAVLQGDPALLVGVQPAHQNGGNGQQCHQPVGAEPGEMHDFRSGCHPTSQRQRPPRFFCRCSSRLLRSAIIFDLRGEPQRADGRQHLRQHAFVMTDGEHALQQIEMQTGHARQATQRVANQALFRGAIHLLDAYTGIARACQRSVRWLRHGLVIVSSMIVGMLRVSRWLLVRVIAAAAHGKSPSGLCCRVHTL